MNGLVRPLAVVLALTGSVAGAGAQAFDHGYAQYAAVLSAHLRPPLVDYASLTIDRARLDRAVAAFDDPASRGEPAWTREQRMAFWINAYNAFTLRVIVDHYPIRSSWFTLQPRNSIRQIDGAWTRIKWRAAGRDVTLDDIEHQILRPTFKDASVHFALNCASASCPPLSTEPYRAATLDAQLETAARAYLSSAEGLRTDGETFRVSSIFDWYGDDFIAEYAPIVPGPRPPKERAILGAIIRHGPPAAATKARDGLAHVGFLSYDWSLNDIAR